MSYRVVAACVLAKDVKGLVHHKYEGQIIDWLSNEQREMFLDLGLVRELGTADNARQPDRAEVRGQNTAGANTGGQREPTPDSATPAQPSEPTGHATPAPKAPGTATDRVTECIQALATLGLPRASGATLARTELRNNGYSFANDIVAAAIKQRKLGLPRDERTVNQP